MLEKFQELLVKIQELVLNFLIQVQDLVEVVLKDILNLVYLAEYYGLVEVAKFWESVV